MRICFVSLKSYPYFNSEYKDTIGGTVSHFANIGRGLLEEFDIEVIFLTADYGQKKNENFEGILTHKSVNYKKKKIVKLIQLIKGFIEVKADIYVISSLMPYYSILTILARLFRKKIIYIFSSDIETDYRHPIFKKLWGRISVYFILHFSNILIVQNKIQEKNILLLTKRKKVFLLKKGILLQQNKTFLRKKYDCIWVGRCLKSKRPELFIKLAEKFSEKKFVIIMARTVEESDFYDKIMAESAKIPNLELYQNLHHSSALEKMSESKILAFTSEIEGDWPMTVLEAASLEVPILSFALNYEHLIDDYQGGVYCSKNWESFQSAFYKILLDENYRLKLSRGAKNYIRDHHDNSVTTKEFYRIISKFG